MRGRERERAMRGNKGIQQDCNRRDVNFIRALSNAENTSSFESDSCANDTTCADASGNVAVDLMVHYSTTPMRTAPLVG